MPEPISTPEVVETTTPESSTETNQEEQTGSSAGTEGNEGSAPQQTDDFSGVPFHEHPRWKQRDQEWERKFEENNARWEKEVEARVSQAVATALAKNQPKDDAPDTTDTEQIPVWFGGGQDTPEVRQAWKEFRRAQKAENESFAKSITEQVLKEIQQGSTAQKDAQDEANKHFEQSVIALEAQHGRRVDREALLKYVVENQIVDLKTQRWDYARGYRWMMAEAGNPLPAGTQPAPNPNPSVPATPPSNKQDRKNLAGASVAGGGKGGDGARTYATSEDFADPSKRPW